MTLKMSTGLCNQLLDTGQLRTIFNLGFIYIYSGTVPADADASIGSAVQIVKISNNSTGTGLTFETSATAGVIPKKSAETWSGSATAGTASFFRLVPATNTTTLSTTEARIQGTVGTGNADMNLTTVSIPTATFTLNNFTLALVPNAT